MFFTKEGSFVKVLVLLIFRIATAMLFLASNVVNRRCGVIDRRITGPSPHPCEGGFVHVADLRFQPQTDDAEHAVVVFRDAPFDEPQAAEHEQRPEVDQHEQGRRKHEGQDEHVARDQQPCRYARRPLEEWKFPGHQTRPKKPTIADAEPMMMRPRTGWTIGW